MTGHNGHLGGFRSRWDRSFQPLPLASDRPIHLQHKRHLGSDVRLLGCSMDVSAPWDDSNDWPGVAAAAAVKEVRALVTALLPTAGAPDTQFLVPRT